MATRSRDELGAIIDAARKELWAIEESDSKKLAAKLIGKCFTYRNCYSGPKPGDYWLLWLVVVGCKDDNCQCIEFQKDKHGSVSVKESILSPGTFSAPSSYKTATRAAAQRAWHKIIASASAMNPF